MQDDPNYMQEDFAPYKNEVWFEGFMEWLRLTNPDWQMEFSGHTLDRLDAWKAGVEWGRLRTTP